MIVGSAESLKEYIESAIKTGLRMQNIEMADSLAVHVIITDVVTGISQDMYMGFPEAKQLHIEQAISTLNQNKGGGIILDGSQN